MSYKQRSPIIIAEGGTNAITMATSFGVNYFDGSKLVTTAVGTSGQVLTSNGLGFAPTFQAIPAGTITAWTPVLTFGGGSTGITYSTQEGYYFRTGNTITFNLTIVLTSKGSSTGTALISGLPVVAFSNTTWNQTVGGNITFGNYLSSAIVSGSATIQPFNIRTGLPSIALTDVDFVNNSLFQVSGTYFVS